MSNDALFEEIEGYMSADAMLEGVTASHRPAVAEAILSRLGRFAYDPRSAMDRGYRLRLKDSAASPTQR